MKKLYRYATHFTVTDEDLTDDWIEVSGITDEEAEAFAQNDSIGNVPIEEVLYDLRGN